MFWFRMFSLVFPDWERREHNSFGVVNPLIETIYGRDTNKQRIICRDKS